MAGGELSVNLCFCLCGIHACKSKRQKASERDMYVCA